MAREHDPSLSVAVLKGRVTGHLEARGLNDKWLYDKLEMSKGSYYDMWRRGSVRADILIRIADALGIELHELVAPPRSSAANSEVREPAAEYRRPFIEERLDKLEERVALMEQKNRPR